MPFPDDPSDEEYFEFANKYALKLLQVQHMAADTVKDFFTEMIRYVDTYTEDSTPNVWTVSSAPTVDTGGMELLSESDIQGSRAQIYQKNEKMSIFCYG